MAYNPASYMPYGAQNWNYANQQPINGLISVTGMDGAKAYQLPPNSSIALFDANDDVMFVKTTDAGGFPTIRAFRFEPIQQEQASPHTDYVTREDFNALAERVDSIVQPKRTRTAKKGESDGE